MDFKDLYNLSETWIDKRVADGSGSFAVPIKYLKQVLKSDIGWIEDINFWPVKCKEGDPLAHYELHGNRQSRWDDDNAWVVLIAYDQALSEDNENDNERFVWAKELMHIFDTEDGQVKDGILFKSLLYQIEIQPPPEDRTAVYWAENAALWKALLILCPKKHRDEQKQKYEDENSDISAYDVAAFFRIPNGVVRSLFSDAYDTAYSNFIETENNA